jgi:hypothetical protein
MACANNMMAIPCFSATKIALIPFYSNNCACCQNVTHFLNFFQIAFIVHQGIWQLRALRPPKPGHRGERMKCTILVAPTTRLEEVDWNITN